MRLRSVLQMSLDEASNKQETYAKSRLVRQLVNFNTSSIPEVLSRSVSSCLESYSWSVEEVLLIRKIVTELNVIHEHHLLLENLLRPLIATYSKQDLSPTTSEPSPIPTDAGDATTSKPE